MLLLLGWSNIVRPESKRSRERHRLRPDIFEPESESELESLEIRRLCSPGYNNMGLVQRVGDKASELALKKEVGVLRWTQYGP